MNTPPAPPRALWDLPAPAKLNLFLHIVGRRDDGYHLLQSVFVPIDWADTLHLERRSDGRLQRHDLGPALPPQDLCWRAASLLQQASGTPYGVDIHLDKQIPWGAGMGGGSSDAATTLLGLNHLWGLHWPRERLAALALQLGADVPFFLGDGPAFVQGIGERLTPLHLPAQAFAVVKPPGALATADIFRHPQLVRNSDPIPEVDILAGSSEDASPRWLQAGFGCNHLQPPAEAQLADVRMVADWLSQRFGNSRMTGSGSAVFARVGDAAGSPAWATFLSELPAGWVARRCCSLARHPLADWSVPSVGRA